ncbi:MAG: hypothetical protein ACI4SB_06590 [Acutalibacteraceae bacterium]
MRKILLFILILAIAFSFVSCKNSEESFIIEPFEAHVEAESGKTVFTGKLKYISPDCMSITIEKPENLKNLTIGTQEGSDFVSIGSMNFVSVPNDIFGGEKNVIDNLFEALGSYKNGFTAKSGKTVSINSAYAYGKCVLSFNTGLKKIEMLDAGKYKYNFSDIS